MQEYFLFNLLKYVNFGDTIIGLIKMMYNNIESASNNNGNTVDYCKLERCVILDCPYYTTSSS